MWNSNPRFFHNEPEAPPTDTPHSTCLVSAASKAGFKYTSSYSLMCMTLALALPLVMFTAFATADNAFMGDEISSAESRMLTSSHDEHVAIHSAPSSPDASSEASNTSAPGSAEGGEAASDAPAGDPSLEASGDQAAERITEREAAAPLGKAVSPSYEVLRSFVARLMEPLSHHLVDRCVRSPRVAVEDDLFPSLTRCTVSSVP